MDNMTGKEMEVLIMIHIIDLFCMKIHISDYLDHLSGRGLVPL